MALRPYSPTSGRLRPYEPKREPSRLEAALIGAIQGATLNAGDELAGAGASLRGEDRFSGSVLRALPIVGPIASLIGERAANIARNEGAGGRADPQYIEARDRFRRTDEAARERHPVTSLASAIGGGVATAPLTGAAGVAGRVGANAVGAGVRAVPGVKSASNVLTRVAAPIGNALARVPGMPIVARGAVPGATAGAAYSAGAAYGGAESGGRMMAAQEAAGWGALFGAGLGAGAAAVGGIGRGAERQARRTPDERALGTIDKAARRDNVDLNVVQAAVDDRARNNGAVIQSAGEFLGPQARGLQVALGNVPGPSRELLAQRFGESVRGAGGQIMRSAQRATGKNPARYHDEVAAYDEVIRERNRLAYEAVEGNPVPRDAWEVALYTPARRNVLPLAFRPDFQRFAETAARSARDRGEMALADELDGFLAAILAGQSARPITVRAVNEIGKLIGDAKYKANQAGDRAIAMHLGQLEDAWRVLDFDTGLGGARKQAAIGFSGQEAFEAGRQALARGTDLEDVVANLKDVPREVADNFLTGFVRAMADSIANQSNLGGLANAAGVIARTPAMRAKLQAALPKQASGALTAASKRFLQVLEDVSDHTRQASQVFGGSATAPRLSAIETAEELTGSGAGDLIDFIGEVVSRQPGRTMARIGAGVRDRITRPGIYNPAVNQALGERLAAFGPDEIRSVLDELRAFRSRPIPPLVDPRLARMAGRAGGFVAGSETAANQPDFALERGRSVSDFVTEQNAAALLAELRRLRETRSSIEAQ